MKKVLSAIIAVSMIICVGIKFNVLSMNTPQDHADRVLIERWQALLSDINRFEERLINATSDENAVLELILHNLKESRDDLASNPHIQRYISITAQQPIRASIPVIRCLESLRPGFIKFLQLEDIRHTIRYTGPSINAATLSPDGNRLALGHTTVRIQNINGQPPIAQNLPLNALLNVIAWSYDGNKLATASDDDIVRIWDANTLTQIGQDISHNEHVNAVAWSHDGNRLATADYNGIVSIWDAHTQTQIGSLRSQLSPICSLAWSPDDSKLAIIDDDNTLRIWNTRSLTRISQKSLYDPHWVTWSPDGSKLAIGPWHDGSAQMLDANTLHNSSAQILDANTLTEINHILLLPYDSDLMNPDVISSVAWNHDSTRVAIGTEAGQVYIWNIKANTFIYNQNFDSRIILAEWAALDDTKFVVLTTNKVIILNNKTQQFLASLNIDQCDLLRAIDMAMQQTGRIQATIDQWKTFTTFPEAIQQRLRLYIKQPPAGPTYEEQNAEIDRRIQQSASSTTKLPAEQPSQHIEKKIHTQEPIRPDTDDNDDDDDASSDGKKRARSTNKEN